MTNNKLCESKDIDAVIEILDKCVRNGDGRIHIRAAEDENQVTDRRYHHGRCDIGSPWACGTAFDVLEDN